MSVQTAGRGRNSHLIKINLGTDPVTGKRLQYTETFRGTKKEARLRAAELLLQKRDKKLVRSSDLTLRECGSKYFDDVRGRLALTTFRTYSTFIPRYLWPALGDVKLKELTRDDFQKVYDSMSADGLSALTVRSLHCVNRAQITWAMRQKLLNEDILKGVELPNVPRAKPEYLTYEETQAFFNVAPNYWYGNAFKFQFLTGLRNQELMALMWEDVNFETSKVLIRRACVWVNGFAGFKTTKTNHDRIVELDDPTIDLLRRQKSEQEAHIRARRQGGLPYGDERLVFCTEDGHVPLRRRVDTCFQRILKEIGVTRRFRWYGVRHTHATHLLDIEGANPKMIANRMGHSVEMLFRIYGHEMPGQQRKAVSEISSRLKL